ncbi:hypothetical protein FVEN_g13166 [Fusarium venenatum]|nr:hypothetical protein FVEN_g13166 [Fusarium venenatum]
MISKYILIICFAGLVYSRNTKIRHEVSTCHTRLDAQKDAQAAGCYHVSSYLISGTLCKPDGCDCEWGCIKSDGNFDEWIQYKCPNGFGSDVCSEE